MGTGDMPRRSEAHNMIALQGLLLGPSTLKTKSYLVRLLPRPMQLVIMDGFCKVGRMEEARKLLSTALDCKILPDVVFSSLIHGVAHVLLGSRKFNGTRAIVNQMIRLFEKADVFSSISDGLTIYGSHSSTVYSFLVDCYCRTGMVDGAVESFI
ncbi:hypothetical protein ACLOJK_032985 [Asimina triloba]